MKSQKFKFVIIVSGLSFYIFAQEPESFSAEYKKALRDGAKARITITVNSPDVGPVSNSLAKVYFEKNDGNQHIVKGMTDANGFFTAEGITRGSVGGSVEKDGFYRSSFLLPVASREPNRLKNGRWIPWNPAIQVILKRKRNPVHMIHSRDDVRIPALDRSFGFDFEKGDLVAPEGKGSVADIIFHFDPIGGTSPFRKLAIEFPGEMNGAYLRKKDEFSILKSDYNASTNAVYESRIENGDGKRGPAHVLLGASDYIVFRIRAKIDGDGNLVSALYGKIYGPFDYFVEARDRLRVSYFLNPVENDTNLEFDGKGFGDGALFGR